MKIDLTKSELSAIAVALQLRINALVALAQAPAFSEGSKARHKREAEALTRLREKVVQS